MKINQMLNQQYLKKMSVKAQNLKETFHGFHSQRQQTTHSLQAKTNKQLADDHHELQLQFAIYYPTRTLLLQFKHALKYDGYKCIQIGDKQLLIIRSKISDRFKKLFMCQQPPKFLVTLTTHQFLSVRTVTIKPLKCNSTFSSKLSLSELSSEVNHIGELLLGLRNLNQANNNGSNELQNEYKQDFFSLDATSYYMFSRMLVDSNYSLGQKILSILHKLKDQENIANCNKKDIHWLHQALNQISDDLLQGFNCSRKELLEILAYCRKSVEQYFYNIHHQHQMNIGRPYMYQSEGYSEQLKELSKIVPYTLKQLLLLERVKTSMQIFKIFFIINLVFKSQCQINRLKQENVEQALHLIRRAFSGVINQKSRLLRSFGYGQQTYQPYIRLFNFDHEITI